MITILKGASVEVHWRVIRTENKITEDFTGAELRAFLVGPDNVYPLECGVEAVDGYNEIRFAVDSKGLSTGVYDLKAVWVKNKHSIPDVVNNQFMLVSRRGGVLAVTDDPSEVTPLPLDKTIKLMSYVESYGRDGMSAYELAAFRGVLPEGMSEAEWANQENVRQQNEEQREAAEDARREAEGEREANERLREQGEAARVSAEAAREAAEGVREATFQTNEAAREAEFGEAIQAAKDNLVVVNDLTTGGADKALSAEMGKELAKESTTEHKGLMSAEDKIKLEKLPRWHSDGTIIAGKTTGYTWICDEKNNPIEVNIPVGSVVRNIGNVRINLYEVYDPDGNHLLIRPNETKEISANYTRIRSANDDGEFKLLVYIDKDIPLLIPQVKNLQEDTSNLQEDQSDLAKDILFNGIKAVTYNTTAYDDINLPIPIPEGLHIKLLFDTDSLVDVFINHNQENKVYRSVKNELDTYSLFEVNKIRISVSCKMTVAILNDSLILGNNVVKNTNIEDDAVTPSKIEGEHIISPNLFDKSTSADGYYINMNSGGLLTSQSFSASDFIPVEENTDYYSYPKTGQYAFYDRYKAYISGNQGNSIKTPIGAAYMRISSYIENKDTHIVNKGTATIPYEPYYRKVKNPNILGGIDNETFDSIDAWKAITSRLWNNSLSIHKDSLSSGETLSLTDYPKSLKKGDKISFFAKITDFGDGIIIGKGTTDYSAAYATITPTQIVLKSYDGTETVRGSVDHNLVIEEYVKVVIDIYPTKWKFVIQTLKNVFETELNCAYSNGTPRITSNGAVMKDINLSCTNSDFARPIWMFGDSYFGISYESRELYWLNKWGYLNCLVQGYAGQGSNSAYLDLQKCLAISKPKYIVWCLGMNDNSSVESWQSYVNNIKLICDKYGAELILQTIPTPLNTTTYKFKEEMSTWIRESNYRYIDAAKAVGSNANGEWYGYGTDYDYQSTDNVHPSKFGASALATQFLIDFPELMQY